MRDGYLVNLQGREHEAIERLVPMPLVGEHLFGPLGLVAAFSWFLLRLPAQRLVRSVRTDVDLIAGRLEWVDPERVQAILAEVRADCPDAHPLNQELLAAWKLAAEDAIRWPPSLKYLVAVEAKAAYLPFDGKAITPDTLRATKESRGEASAAPLLPTQTPEEPIEEASSVRGLRGVAAPAASCSRSGSGGSRRLRKERGGGSWKRCGRWLTS